MTWNQKRGERKDKRKKGREREREKKEKKEIRVARRRRRSVSRRCSRKWCLGWVCANPKWCLGCPLHMRVVVLGVP